MNATPSTIIQADIGEQSYTLRIAPNSGLNVDEAIAAVSARYQAVLQAGEVINPERIAIMVALNIAMEAQQLKADLLKVLQG
jgi:cell division protein ZapA (FtsZ GTPase activity inhibitor)